MLFCVKGNRFFRYGTYPVIVNNKIRFKLNKTLFWGVDFSERLIAIIQLITWAHYLHLKIIIVTNMFFWDFQVDVIIGKCNSSLSLYHKKKCTVRLSHSKMSGSMWPASSTFFLYLYKVILYYDFIIMQLLYSYI